MSRIVAVLVAGFSGGVLMRSFFDFGLSFALFFIFIGAIAGLIYLFLKLHKNVFFAGLFLFSAGLGILRYDIKEIRNTALEREIGSKTFFQAVVVDEPNQKENYAQLVVEEEETKTKILLIARPYPEFHYGDRIKILGKLEKPKKYADSEFDWPAYLAKEDIYYEMVYPQMEILSEKGGFWLKRWLFGVKEKFIDNLSAVIPEPHAGYLAGLTVGAKQSMSEDLLEKFREVGVIHIIVLSGYNITIVASGVMGILKFMPSFFGIGFGMLGILLFALMTGASATVVRASIMASLALMAKATGRIYQITIALLAAGFLMVFHNPKILRFDASFQLSFLATLALIYVSPLVEKKIYFVPKKFHLWEIASATISTQIFVLPFLLYKMGLFSFVALPVNLLILIFIPATMFFGFAAGISGFTSTLLGTSISGILAIPFGWIAYAFSAYELWVVDIFSKFPFASFNFSIPFWLMILIYCIYAFMIFKLNKKYALGKK